MSLIAQRRTVLEEVYAAFRSLDPEQIEAVCTAHFAPDIVIREPESLPYGGVYSGLDTARGLFGGLVTGASPIDAAALELDHLIGSDDSPHVIAAVRFPWQPPGCEEALPMRALEWFTFREAQIIEIQPFFWDLAACLERLEAAPR